MSEEREMSLTEYAGQLHPEHRVNKELKAMLKAYDRHKAEIERLKDLISGKAADNPGHPFWKNASRDELLDLARFQSAITKEYMKECDELYAEIERLTAEREKYYELWQSVIDYHEANTIPDAERWQKLEQEVDYLHIYVVPSTGDAYANVEALRKAIDAAKE